MVRRIRTSAKLRLIEGLEWIDILLSSGGGNDSPSGLVGGRGGRFGLMWAGEGRFLSRGGKRMPGAGCSDMELWVKAEARGGGQGEEKIVGKGLVEQGKNPKGEGRQRVRIVPEV